MRVLALRSPFVGATLALLAALAGCTTPNSTPAAAATPIGATHTVQMTATNTFAPQEVRVFAGDVVEWRNVSTGAQSVTLLRSVAPMLVAMPTGALEFDSGRIAPGGAFRRQFTLSGRYQYVSTTNAGVDMVGVVLVVDR